ncbi:MAG: hypothetical protein U0744_20715 [Gemmataceae bacterium]
MARPRRAYLPLACTVVVLGLAVAFHRASDQKAAPPLLDGMPRWWKGNLHTHSFWSDGDDFPEMIADWYRQHKYHFLSLTDHNVLSEGQRWVDAAPKAKALAKYVDRFGPSWVERRTVADKDKTKDKEQVRLKPLAEFRSVLEESGKFLLMPGEEITHKYGKFPVHINGINLRDVVTPVDGPSVAEVARVHLRAVESQAEKTGWSNLAFINHPNFGWGFRVEDMLEIDEIRYFEIFNGHPDVKNYGDKVRPSVERIWDILNAVRLNRGQPVVFGVATDDAHAYHEMSPKKANPGRGWVQVRAPHLTPEAMVKGMKKGDFYASSGVSLDDVKSDEQGLKLKIAGAEGVRYKTQFIITRADTPIEGKPRMDDKGVPISGEYDPAIGAVVAEVEGLEPAYQFKGDELYVRARIISDRLHPNPYQKGDVEMAWTQPAVRKSAK